MGRYAWKGGNRKTEGTINKQYPRTKYKPGKQRNKQQLTETDKTQNTKFTNTTYK